MAESTWDDTVKEWLVDQGICYAGGLASASDCVVYAAAADDGNGWGHLMKDGYEIEILDEEGNVSGTQNCVEAETIKMVLEEGRAPNGVWIGGVKYKFISKEAEFEYNEATYETVLLARPKGGAHLVKTQGGTVVIALYDEEKEQQKASSLTSALEFANFLNSQGY